MGKLTQEQREQVVELLRCAADVGQRNEGPVLCAALNLGLPLGGATVDIALRAWSDVLGDAIEDDGAIAAVLEAAQRVEEGSWP